MPRCSRCAQPARARGATAYVTLEPCSHVGRTPPCADALIAAGVARVVAATPDSNPRVAGGGFAALHKAGVVVETGLLQAQARELNRGFFARVERGRPWLRIKLATSLDGRTALANGESKWITGEAARADVQRWRARSSAILTGSGTALADDPRLTVRDELRGADGARVDDPPKPVRVVLDSHLRTPAGAALLDGAAPTLFLHGAGAPADGARFAHAECEAVACDAQGRLDLGAALAALARRGANEVQVEAGPTLCGALLEAGLVDELLLYVAPLLLGDRARGLLDLAQLTSMQSARRLRVVDRRMLGDDERILLRN